MISRHLEEFPGLVHFIHVDRCVDQVTAPTINTTSTKVRDPRNPSYVIKQKIWDMWTYIQSYLQRGKKKHEKNINCLTLIVVNSH